MNRVYRLIWSETSHAWVAIAETSRGRGKGSSRKLMAAALSLTAAVAQATPVDGKVVTGVASITQSGATTTIQQASQSLALSWKSFNVAAQETVNFVQPSASSVAVNRIFDSNASQIFGRLNANGQVYLINPNGVLFGKSAQVNVGGLVATTLGLNDASLTSNTKTFSGSGSGSIINQGTINAASGGYVALLGNTVTNQGSITAPLGTVALGAGNAVTLTFSNNSLAKMQVDQSVLNSLAENGGLIRADGGMVVMNAGAKNTLLTSVVNNTGVIEARTLQNHNGTITLLAGMTAGTTNVAGKLDASAPNGGNGGFIETSGAYVKVAEGTLITSAAPKGITGTWLIDPLDFTISAGSAPSSSSSIGASTLSSNLSNVNVSIATDASTAGNGDIFVNAPVSWSANKLTLTAHRNININANLNVSNTASLALEYGQGAAAFENTSHITTKAAAVNLPAGTNNFTTKQGSDGAVKNYTVITSLGAQDSVTTGDLQGMNGNTAANYVLGSDIVATATSNWNGGAGFTPIAEFAGTFDGLGHTITNLSINRPGVAGTGLFGTAAASAVIQNVGLVGGSTVGAADTGALLGKGTTGSIHNSYATGSVSGAAGTGGLVGSLTTGSITNSYATGNVSSNNGAGVGGLIGSLTTGDILNSYATGDVSGAAGTGGLVGSKTTGAIAFSYATGNVSGNAAAGVGGLVGSNTAGNITYSYATGNVSGGAGTGGLVGSSTSGNVTYSYATGDVYGSGAGTGGLMGANTSGALSNSFATGSVTGLGAGTGGLLGATTSTSHAGNFWDVTASGQTTSAGGAGVTSMTTAEMKQQINFTSATAANGNVNPGWNFGDTWVMVDGSLPVLKSLMTYSTVTANNATASYTGQSGSGFSGGNGVTYSGLLSGTVTYSGTSQGAKNAGSYIITPGGLSANSTNPQHIVTFVNGTLVITPASLSVKSNNVSKIYDGSQTALGTASVVGGTLFGGDTLSGGTFAFTDKNVGIGKTVTTTGVTVGNGVNNNNYLITYVANTASSISKAALSLSTSAVSKTYDAGLSALGTAVVRSGTLFGGDTLSGGTFAFTDKNAGTGKTVITSGVTVGDGVNNNNYLVTYGVNTASTISKAALSLSNNAVTKTYDGGLTALSTATVVGGTLFGSDTLSAGTFAFTDKNAGIGKTVTTSGVKVGSGTNFNNYLVSYVNSTVNKITQAEISVRSGNVIKSYDGNVTALGSIYVTSGKLFGTDSMGSGTFAFTDKNAGTGNKTVRPTGVTINDTNAGGNYLVKYIDNTTSTIRQANLNLSTINVSKTYDGDLTALGSVIKTSGTLFSGDTLSGGTFAFTNKNAATGTKMVTTRGVTVGDGLNNNNYAITYDNNITSTINKAELTLSSSAVSKTYDGGITALGRAVVTGGTLFSGDTLSGGTFAFTDKNAGTSKTVTTTGVKVGDGINNNNYMVKYANNIASSIAQANLTLSTSNVVKTYDSTLAALGKAIVSSGKLFGTDTLSGGTFAFTDKNAGIGNKTVSTSGVTLNDGNSGANYRVSYANNIASTISQAKLILSTLNVSKTYDGSLLALGTAVVKGGTLFGTDTLSGGTFAFTNNNIGMGKTVTASAVTVGNGTNNSNYAVTYVNNTNSTIKRASP